MASPAAAKTIGKPISSIGVLKTEFLADDTRYSGERELEKPLAAVQMGLIYVNPEGPGGNHDPISAAADIRETFGRMAMNDEETVALIAGGHTFGKAHGAVQCRLRRPRARRHAAVEEQGFGWKNSCGEPASGVDAMTSGLEGAWSANPIEWSTQYLDNLLSFTWVQERSPAGAVQWVPEEEISPPRWCPTRMTRKAPQADHVHDRPLAEGRPDRIWRSPPASVTTQMSTRTHSRALGSSSPTGIWGPRARYLGDMVPDEELAWQDPVPTPDYHAHQRSRRRRRLKRRNPRLRPDNVSELVRTAWASAASFRGSDMRGGANGARVRLAPQMSGRPTRPDELSRVLETLKGIQTTFNDNNRRKQVSLADIIVLGGAAAIEKAAADAGYEVEVPFTPGRGDATAEQTDAASFEVLEPTADGFRNYYGGGHGRSPARQALVDQGRPVLTLDRCRR